MKCWAILRNARNTINWVPTGKADPSSPRHHNGKAISISAKCSAAPVREGAEASANTADLSVISLKLCLEEFPVVPPVGDRDLAQDLPKMPKPNWNYHCWI